MEPMGLAVSGLAALAGACANLLAIVESACDYHKETRHAFAQFQADKQLFQRWTSVVGISDNVLDDKHHPALDDQHTRSAVALILSSIHDIFSAADFMSHILSVDLDGPAWSLGTGTTISGTPTSSVTKKVSIRTKLKWGTRDKVKFDAQINLLAVYVEKLFALIPMKNIDDSLNPGLQKRLDDLQLSLDEDARKRADWMAHSQGSLLKLMEMYESEKREKTLAWLGATLTDSDFQMALMSRLDGTCSWIMERDEFKNWLHVDEHKQARFLWIHGPAGFGKTILAASIIQHLELASHPTIYFFCRAENEEKNNTGVILRSWVSQMVATSSAALAVASIFHRGRISSEATEVDLWELFRLINSSLLNAIFVVDGLDECSRRDRVNAKGHGEFLQRLKLSVSYTGSRILVISRDEVEIQNQLRGRATADSNLYYEYKICSADVRSDIVSYSRSVLQRRLPKKSQLLKEELAGEMVDKCQGQFLWIRLQEDHLSGWKSTKDLRKVISEMPPDLEGAYLKDLERISSLNTRDRERAFAILRWVLFASTPLTVVELAEALAVEGDNSKCFPVGNLPDEIDEIYINEGIIGFGGTLLEVHGRDDVQPLSSHTVHFVHVSVREYLLAHLEKSSIPGSPQFWDIERQHDHLVKICLQYLCYDDIGICVTESDIQRHLERHPFLLYAIKSWPLHHRNSGQSFLHSIKLLKKFFHPTYPGWLMWREVFESEGSLSTIRADPTPNSLYYASLFGLCETVDYLLELGSDVNAVGGRYGFSLQAAAALGQVKVVKKLLDNGADVDLQGGKFGCAINAAVASGNKQIVDLLVNAGASLLVKTKEGQTPLILAAEHGLDEIVQLMAKSIELDITDDMGQSALHKAAKNGYTSIVKLLVPKANLTQSDNGGYAPLNLAAESGKLEVIKVLLENGADPTRTTDMGRTPFYSAALYGHTRVLKHLLELGTDFTVANKYGWTPLNVAADEGHLEVVELLLESGADMEMANEGGWAPLNSAADSGHVEVVKLLLGKGADVTAANKDGWTPLNSAASGGHAEVVKILLEGGADVAVASEGGWTPLNSAAGGGHVKVVKLLLGRGADVMAATKARWTPLNSAASGGHAEVVKILLERDADMEVANEGGWTPLNSAAESGHVEVVKLLLERGADMEVANENGWTPLNSAANSGHVEVVKLLLERGADTEVANEGWWTPLNSAANSGHVEVMKLLLERGADMAVANENGWTPLNCAARGGHVEVVKILLEKGADTTVTNKNGWTPLNSAADSGHVEVMKLLLERDADVAVASENGWTPLNSAAESGHIEVVKLLLERGADTEVANENGWTPLNSAAESGHVEVVKLLLERGADMEVANENGWTPLNSAANSDRVEVVRLLLEWGADVTTTNKQGWIPLLAAARGGCLEIMKILLDQIDKSIVDGQGRNTLHLAARGGHLDIINYLLDLGLEAAAKDKRGFTILHYAAASGSLETLGRVLQIPRLDWNESNGWSALHWAARSGNPQMFQLLSKSGIQDNTVETLEPPGIWTAYSISVFHQNLNFISELSNNRDGSLDITPRGVGLDFTSRTEQEGNFAQGIKHDDRYCDGCLHVSRLIANTVVRASQANLKLGHIRSAVSLHSLFRFRLLFHV
ncbi:MAG: hypothetical protein M1813_006513 [Trichoglossum hirsutum]|nr:MAG: hypothetical protein M1813_006513 [Trichoglossum hirsutum]